MFTVRGRIYYGLFLSLVLVVTLFGGPGHASPSFRYHYDFIKVDINILPNGDMEITETQKFAYNSGDFHYGYRWIPTNKVEAIEQVEIWEGDHRYEANPAVRSWIVTRESRGGSFGGENRAFTTLQEGGKLWIGWWFPKTTAGQSRTFTLKYLVKGGLRIYDTGDQLYWKAIFADRKVPIKRSTVTVHLPAAVSREQLQIVTYGVPAVDKIIDERTIEFTTSWVPPRWELEVKVTFPHGLVKAKPPAWQASVGRRKSNAVTVPHGSMEDNQSAYLGMDASTFRLIIMFGGLIAFMVGSLWLWRTWQDRGPEPDVGPQPDYLTSPPSDLPPAMVHLIRKYWLLKKGQTSTGGDAQLVMATLLDLARQGVVSLELVRKPGWEKRRVKIIELNKKANFEFENLVVSTLAGHYLSGGEIALLLPEFKKSLGKESVDLGFFEEEPIKAEKHMQRCGLVMWGTALAASLCVLIFWITQTNDWMVLYRFVGLGIVGLVADFLVAPIMPKRTRKGVQEAALWSAFGNYLKEISQRSDMDQDSLDLWNFYYSEHLID